MERQKFEESLKKTFDQAEFTPSERVWTDIELELERLERGDMKKRLLFYKFLAAASVAFALAVAGTGAYLLTGSSDDNPTAIAEQRPAPEQPDVTTPERNVVPGILDDTQATPVNPSPPASPTDERMASVDRQRNEERGSKADETHEAGIGLVSVTDDRQDAPVLSRVVTFRERALPSLVKPRKIIPHFPKTEPDQIDLLLASIEMEERASREKKKFEGEKVWTSVGFSAGTFNNHSAGAPAPVMNTLTSTVNFTSANNTLNNEAAASGVSYSIGVNVGGKIAPRWVLQGGLNYMTQNAAFTSDAVVTQDNRNFKAAYSAEITKMADASARVVPTAPYSVTNNMEYLSIPLQAGYIVVNRAFGIQLNGGISTDLFIQNTLEPQSGSLDKVTNGRGSDSPYRPINFSGLVGTEISYRFSENYRIAVNPGIRYPFSSIYKSDVGLSVTPLTFDIGLRFKYIFQ